MIWQIILLIFAIPVGYIIAYLARDELISGRKWFIIIIAVSFVASIAFYFLQFSPAAWASLFILIVAVISLMRSYDKEATQKRLASTNAK